MLLAAFGGLAALPAAAQTGGGNAPGSTTPPPAPRLVVNRPTKRVFIKAGNTDRLLLGGRWYFRLDDQRVGERRRQDSGAPSLMRNGPSGCGNAARAPATVRLDRVVPARLPVQEDVVLPPLTGY